MSHKGSVRLRTSLRLTAEAAIIYCGRPPEQWDNGGLTKGFSRDWFTFLEGGSSYCFSTNPKKREGVGGFLKKENTHTRKRPVSSCTISYDRS